MLSLIFGHWTKSTVAQETHCTSMPPCSIPGISPSAASVQEDPISALMVRLGQLDGIRSRLSFEKGTESDGENVPHGAESTLAKWVMIQYPLNSQMTPHTSSSRVSYTVAVVSIGEKFHGIIYSTTLIAACLWGSLSTATWTGSKLDAIMQCNITGFGRNTKKWCVLFCICRYIKRFREGHPMSRKEREKAESATKGDFWWLHSRSEPQPSDSSTPKSDRDVKVTSRSQKSRSPPSYFSHHSEISKHSVSFFF